MRSEGQKRRIVVGDIHGELDGFREILWNAGLVDRKDAWSGGDAVLIQTGDVIDRGPWSRESVEYLRRVQKEAVAAEGRVVRLCGNHALMVLQKNFYYADFEDPEAFASELKGEILQGKVQAAYTDGERLYTHAGLKSEIRKVLLAEMKLAGREFKPIEKDLLPLSDHINRIFRESIEKEDFDHPIFRVGHDRGGRDRVGGIFWCDFASISPSAEDAVIPQIFGHTPARRGEVRTAHGLRLINVDAGMCWEYGGARVYIEITPDGRLLQHSKVLSKWKTTELRPQ
ncbi:MAG: metallophosphoesterase [Deltaproteobacteria bacterium]|nr:metallophosphoesterase [Deltaproteobacteria bacterium]